MKLAAYLAILKCRKWLIAAAVLVATLVAGLIAARTPASYTAAATVVFSCRGAG
jgi:uncharacterized protein involved in exopolysaccharide biosynthesis